MVKTKAEYIARSQAGQLGNYLKSWDRAIDVLESDYTGYLTIRNRVFGSPHFIPVTQRCCLVSHVALLESRGEREENLYFQQIPPPGSRRVIQFEAVRSERGIDLCYELDTTEPLRGIRDRGKWASGLMAASVLRTYLSPGSYDDLWEIWGEHPTSVIEATEFSENVGEFSRPLLFWEVRDF